MVGSVNIKLKKSVNLLRETIPRMNQLQIPLTPENYHTWYEYTMGRYDELNQEIDSLIESGTKFTSKVNNALYNTYINISPEEALLSYQSDIQKLVSTLLDKINSMTESTQNFSGTLEKHKTKLVEKPDITAIACLISNLIDYTDSVIQSNKSMENMLESMNQEVSTLRANLTTLNAEAFTDKLTAVPNRRAFD